MPITEHGSTPAVVTGTGVGNLVTAAFTPPAGTLLIALVAAGYANSPTVPGITISGGGGTWTAGPTQGSSGGTFFGRVSIFYRWLDVAPGSTSVTATYTNLVGGRFMAVRVLSGAAASQVGAGSATRDITVGTTAWTQSITTTRFGSQVYGVCDDPVANDVLTAAANSTLVGAAFQNATDSISCAACKATATTGTPGATTLGFTNAASQLGVLALFEVLPDAGGSGSRQPVHMFHPGRTPGFQWLQPQLQRDTIPPITPVAYTQTLVDSAGLSDTAAVGPPALPYQAGLLLIGGTAGTVSGGDSWTAGSTDSAGLTDAVEETRAPAAADSAGLTDLVVKDLASAPVDSAGLTDARAEAVGQAQADSAGLTDVSLVELAHLVTQTDSAGLTDVVAKTIGPAPTDTAGLTDTQAADLGKGQVDSAGLTDVSLVEQAKLVTQVDSAGLTDVTAAALGSAPVDTTGLTDTVAKDLLKAQVDSSGLTDTSAVESGRLLAATDSAGLTDTASAAYGFAPVDSTGLSDLQAAARAEAFGDLAGLTDVSLVEPTKLVTQVDSAGLTDTSEVTVVAGTATVNGTSVPAVTAARTSASAVVASATTSAESVAAARTSAPAVSAGRTAAPAVSAGRTSAPTVSGG
jgi:hypothetical protein